MRIDRRTLIVSALVSPALPAVTRAQDTEVLEDEDPPWILLAGQDSGPAGRWGHALIIDTWYGRLLVIGGRDDDGTVRGDFWVFDLASYTWSELDLSGPKARSGSATAIAADGSGFYYFGGESNDATFDDLWWFGFDSNSWQQIEPAVGASPRARAGSRGVIDSLGRFVISHGRKSDELFDDTWAFEPSSHTWTDISPDAVSRPMARSDHDMVALPDYGLILLTGGCSDGIGPCPQGDLWVFDVAGGNWSNITPDIGPTPRTGAALSRLGQDLLLVGGETDLGPESDVWSGVFNGGTVAWIERTIVNHGPMGIYRRYLHDMTAAGDEFFVFGGHGVEGALSDLWQFSLKRLSESEHTVQPDQDSQ